MARLEHASGIFEISSESQLGHVHPLTPDEQAALISAKREDPAAAVPIAQEIGGALVDEKGLPKALQAIRSKADIGQLRITNLQLTKQGIRESVTPDAHLIQAVLAIEEIDRAVNALAKRLRSWHALYAPEVGRSQKDHREFARAILEMKERNHDSMGGAASEADLAAMCTQAALIEQLYAQRDALVVYLEAGMKEYTPNLLRVAGPTIGARLLSIAGSLLRLSRMPSGTIQLLGAETALFRHLKNRSARPPKHGVIFNHQLIQKAPREKRGKAARAIADTITIAARIDYFKGAYMGDELVKRMEGQMRK